MREQPLLEPHDEYDRELEPLCRVQGDQRDPIWPVLQLVLVADQRDLLEQALQAFGDGQLVKLGRMVAQLQQVGPALLPLFAPVLDQVAQAGSVIDRVEQRRRSLACGNRGQSVHQVREPAQRSLRSGGQVGILLDALDGLPNADPACISECTQGLQRLLPDPAGRNVDHALERHPIGGVAREPDIAERVLYLAPLIEAGAADKLVRDPEADERLLQDAALRVDPIGDRDLPIPQRAVLVVGAAGEDAGQGGTPATSGQTLHLTGDELCLLVLVVGVEDGDLGAAAAIGPQLLVLAAGVAADDGVGSIEDRLGGPVVLLELHDLGIRVVALEVEDVAQVGAAPRVDALVIVAHHRQVAVLGGQQAAEQVLRAIGVLVLVDQDLLPAPLVAGQHIRILLEQEDRAHQQVVEVDRVVLGQLALVCLVDAGGSLVVEVGGLAPGGGRVGQLVLALPDPGQHPRRGEALLVEVELLEDGLGHRHLVGPIVDGEAPGQTDGAAVAAQDAGADGVEGADRRLAGRLFPDQTRDPVAHLVGGLVGEGDGHDLPRPGPGGHQVGDSMGQHPRLAAPRSGKDQERTGVMRHRLALRLVQSREDLIRRDRDSVNAGRGRGGSLLGLRLGGHRSI